MFFCCFPPLKVSERHLWRADAKGEKAHPPWAEARHLLKKGGSSKRAYCMMFCVSSCPCFPFCARLRLEGMTCGRLGALPSRLAAVGTSTDTFLACQLS
jgi:hypothetical protein